MIALHSLTPAGKKKKRVGRGGSRGGTSGKGHKGQKARSGGKTVVGFEGGQMPLYRRIPKRGFTNAPFKDEIQIVDIAQLERVFEDGQEVTREALVEKRLIKNAKSSQTSTIKVLGNTGLTKKLLVTVNACSQSARALIEQQGGTVTLTKES